MIVDDSCFRLTTFMIGHYSFPDSCFGNHRLDSETFRCKWQCPPLAILPPIFTFRFRFSFCPSSLPPTLSRFIFRTFLQQIDYQKTSCRPLSSRKNHTFTSYGTLFGVHIFTRKELGTRCSRDFARGTANFFGRLTM